ncbi:MAG: hypothetical protein HZB80_03495 [Deltaproteobacteria bacterium]|nr:hypothetical protein [Deltaproteobacteria bacterium]
MSAKFNYDLIELASRNEKAFIQLVKKESTVMPASVRLFLADKIRNAITGLEKNHNARVKILNALETIGI